MSLAGKADIVERVEGQTGRKRRLSWRWGGQEQLLSLAAPERTKPRPAMEPCYPNENTVYWPWPGNSPTYPARQISVWITDNEGFAVSESTVYRILRREGLVSAPSLRQRQPGNIIPGRAALTRCGPRLLLLQSPRLGYYYLVTVMTTTPVHFGLGDETELSANSSNRGRSEGRGRTGMTNVP